MTLPISDLLPRLQTPKRCVIICHTKPDGDAAGSVLGLSHYLQLRGHHITVIFPSELPDFLSWMPGADASVDAEADLTKAEQAIEQCDYIFCLDFNDISRTKVLEPALEAALQPKVMIDHHMFPKPQFAYGISEPEKSSTCEMVYDFILAAGDEQLLNTTIATCLYTGMMTDTGSFRYSSTGAGVHRAVAHFLEIGLQHSLIHEAVYDSWSADRMRFMGYVLIEKMEVFAQHHTGLIAISKKDTRLFKATPGDTEGLVNYPLSIKGIQFAALITERSDEVKLSFRSKGSFDVNAIAREYFHGGGHLNASGGRSNLGFNETVEYFKSILPHIAPHS